MLGEHIRTLRKQNGLTQVELAERAQVTEATVRRLERGRQSPYTPSLVAIAGALGVKPDALITGHDTDSSPGESVAGTNQPHAVDRLAAVGVGPSQGA